MSRSADAKTILVSLAAFPALVSIEGEALVRVDSIISETLLSREGLVDVVEAGEGYFVLTWAEGHEIVQISCQFQDDAEPTP